MSGNCPLGLTALSDSRVLGQWKKTFAAKSRTSPELRVLSRSKYSLSSVVLCISSSRKQKATACQKLLEELSLFLHNLQCFS